MKKERIAFFLAKIKRMFFWIGLSSSSERVIKIFHRVKWTPPPKKACLVTEGIV